MSFTLGFTKISGVMDGLKAAGGQTVKDVLALKGAREAVSDVAKKYKGNLKDLVKTKAGRADLGEAVVKSLPSAAAGAAYAGIAHKAYKSMKKDNSTPYDQYYMQ